MKKTIRKHHLPLLVSKDGETEHCHNCRYLYVGGNDYMCSSWLGIEGRHKNITQYLKRNKDPLYPWLVQKCPNYKIDKPRQDFQLF